MFDRIYKEAYQELEMKVNAHSQALANQSSTKQGTKPQKLSNDEIANKIKAKFGKVAEIKKAPEIKDSVELNSKGVVSSDEENFGDVKENNPASEVTQEKLKSILKSGGFNFNDKERKALGQILM
mgnify:CR=1 FL=1